jgi:hypothetical protein
MGSCRSWRLRGGVVGLIGLYSVLLTGCGGATRQGDPSASPPAPLSLHAGQRLAAVGFRPQGSVVAQADGAAWQDRRLAFGLNQLLAESFYATGQFRLVEARDIQRRELIEHVVQSYWTEPQRPVTPQDLAPLGARLEADLLAYGVIAEAGISGRRFFLGPISSHQQTLQVRVEVCLFEVATRSTFCREGQGIAQQEGAGVIYEFRHDRVDFERNAAGRATKQAVASAVREIIAAARFTP